MEIQVTEPDDERHIDYAIIEAYSSDNTNLIIVPRRLILPLAYKLMSIAKTQCTGRCHDISSEERI